MSIDVLHEKIRKLKNPLIVEFGMKQSALPAFLLEGEETPLKAYARFCRELLDGLKGVVPGVRFSVGAFSLYGPEGLNALIDLLHLAEESGFYVVLDSPEILSPWGADSVAERIFDIYPCDALIISPYIGSDAIKPFVPCCKKDTKDLFVVIRSPNKTAAELQDLLTGTRHVYDLPLARNGCTDDSLWKYPCGVFYGAGGAVCATRKKCSGAPVFPPGT